MCSYDLKIHVNEGKTRVVLLGAVKRPVSTRGAIRSGQGPLSLFFPGRSGEGPMYEISLTTVLCFHSENSIPEPPLDDEGAADQGTVQTPLPKQHTPSLIKSFERRKILDISSVFLKYTYISIHTVYI